MLFARILHLQFFWCLLSMNLGMDYGNLPTSIVACTGFQSLIYVQTAIVINTLSVPILVTNMSVLLCEWPKRYVFISGAFTFPFLTLFYYVSMVLVLLFVVPRSIYLTFESSIGIFCFPCYLSTSWTLYMYITFPGGTGSQNQLQFTLKWTSTAGVIV